MFKAFSTAAFFAATLLVTSPAIAEPNVACNYGTSAAWDQISLMYEGPWQIAHHAGYVMAGPMTMPFPASGDLETMQIETLPSVKLVGTHPEAQQPIPFVWADEPPWSFEADADKDGRITPLELGRFYEQRVR